MNRFRYFAFKKRCLGLFIQLVTGEFCLKFCFGGEILEEMCINHLLDVMNALEDDDELCPAIKFRRLMTRTRFVAFLKKVFEEESNFEIKNVIPDHMLFYTVSSDDNMVSSEDGFAESPELEPVEDCIR